MKILYLCDSLNNTSNGGSSLSGQTILNFITNKFKDVTVISDQLISPPVSCEKYSVKLIKRFSNINYDSPSLFVRSILKKIFVLFRSSNLYLDVDDDCIIFVNSFLDFSNRVHVNNPRYKTSKVIIVRGDVDSFKFQPFLNGITSPEEIAFSYLSSFNEIIYVSNTIKNNWVQYTNFKHNSYVLFNSINEDNLNIDYQNPFNHSKKINVVLIGSVQSRKGQDILKYIAPHFSESINFHIIGNVSKAYYGEVIFNELSSFENIYFHGHKENPFNYLQHCDVALSLSRSEAFPRTIAEYMANGCLIISTKVAGADEMIIHNENGFLVEIDNYKSVIAYLKLVIHNPNKYNIFRKNVKADYLSKYSIKKQNNSFIKILESFDVFK